MTREVCCHERPASLRHQPAHRRPDRLGARWIIDPDGRVDQVWDRTDAIGPDARRHELLGYLNDHVGHAPQQQAEQLLGRGELSWSDERRVTLYEDEVVTVVANPRRS